MMLTLKWQIKSLQIAKNNLEFYNSKVLSVTVGLFFVLGFLDYLGVPLKEAAFSAFSLQSFFLPQKGFTLQSLTQIILIENQFA
jgi:hypothetical protein